MPQACRRTSDSRKRKARPSRDSTGITPPDTTSPELKTLRLLLVVSNLTMLALFDDVKRELILRHCEMLCCLSVSSVRFRLPYFNSVLLQICCGCRCSKIMITSCLSGRMSLLNIYPCLPMPHSCTTHASFALVLDHVSRHARSES